jgi:hypothetical protein
MKVLICLMTLSLFFYSEKSSADDLFNNLRAQLGTSNAGSPGEYAGGSDSDVVSGVELSGNITGCASAKVDEKISSSVVKNVLKNPNSSITAKLSSDKKEIKIVIPDYLDVGTGKCVKLIPKIALDNNNNVRLTFRNEGADALKIKDTSKNNYQKMKECLSKEKNPQVFVHSGKVATFSLSKLKTIPGGKNFTFDKTSKIIFDSPGGGDSGDVPSSERREPCFTSHYLSSGEYLHRTTTSFDKEKANIACLGGDFGALNKIYNQYKNSPLFNDYEDILDKMRAELLDKKIKAFKDLTDKFKDEKVKDIEREDAIGYLETYAELMKDLNEKALQPAIARLKDLLEKRSRMNKSGDDLKALDKKILKLNMEIGRVYKEREDLEYNKIYEIAKKHAPYSEDIREIAEVIKTSKVYMNVYQGKKSKRTGEKIKLSKAKKAVAKAMKKFNAKLKKVTEKFRADRGDFGPAKRAKKRAAEIASTYKKAEALYFKLAQQCNVGRQVSCADAVRMQKRLAKLQKKHAKLKVTEVNLTHKAHARRTKKGSSSDDDFDDDDEFDDLSDFGADPDENFNSSFSLAGSANTTATPGYNQFLQSQGQLPINSGLQQTLALQQQQQLAFQQQQQQQLALQQQQFNLLGQQQFSPFGVNPSNGGQNSAFTGAGVPFSGFQQPQLRLINPVTNGGQNSAFTGAGVPFSGFQQPQLRLINPVTGGIQ